MTIPPLTPPKGEDSKIIMRYRYETTDATSYKMMKEYAKKNKKYSTEAERALWEALRGNNMGVHFRRQHPIDCYIADFVCLEKMLIVEVDGGYHSERDQQEDDEERTKYLNVLGYRVVRFTNEEVFGDMNRVLHTINMCINDNE